MVSLGYHRFSDEKDHAFEVMKTSQDYDASIPTWYLEKHTARGVTTIHLHFPHRGQKCYQQCKIHPEYSITYDKQVALKPDAIHIGSLVLNDPSVLAK